MSLLKYHDLSARTGASKGLRSLSQTASDSAGISKEEQVEHRSPTAAEAHAHWHL